MRLLAKSVLDTITRGKRLVNSVTITAIVPRPVIVNAQIWRRMRTKTTARTSAAIPITAGSTGGKTFLSFRSTATTTVAIRNAAPSAAATSDIRAAARPARASRSPFVRSVRNVAPWNTKIATTARPPSSVYQLNRSQKVPVKSLLELIGVPYSRLAKPTPQISDAPKLPTAFAQSHTFRQPRLCALRPPFERDHADDQEEQRGQQRDVEAGEHRRVPGRERGERRAAGGDEPHLVAVPHGADRLEHRAALLLVAREEREQHADAEVESLEQEVARPEDDDEHEPEVLEIHQ